MGKIEKSNMFFILFFLRIFYKNADVAQLARAADL